MLRLHGNVNGGPSGSDHRRPDADDGYSPYQRRIIFREMAKAELRGGALGRQRRFRLVQYAAKLRLSAVVAGRLMGEARQSIKDETIHAAEHQVPNLRLHEPPSRTSHTSRWIVTGALCIVVAALGLFLLW
ncbi:MAG: hypothetical protein IID37_05510 [Planctomycetes bacterium]|nr:hypothetical protein [Planctomycetota bacterium]